MPFNNCPRTTSTSADLPDRLREMSHLNFEFGKAESTLKAKKIPEIVQWRQR